MSGISEYISHKLSYSRDQVEEDTLDEHRRRVIAVLQQEGYTFSSERIKLLYFRDVVDLPKELIDRAKAEGIAPAQMRSALEKTITGLNEIVTNHLTGLVVDGTFSDNLPWYSWSFPEAQVVLKHLAQENQIPVLEIIRRLSHLALDPDPVAPLSLDLRELNLFAEALDEQEARPGLLVLQHAVAPIVFEYIKNPAAFALEAPPVAWPELRLGTAEELQETLRLWAKFLAERFIVQGSGGDFIPATDVVRTDVERVPNTRFARLTAIYQGVMLGFNIHFISNTLDLLQTHPVAGLSLATIQYIVAMSLTLQHIPTAKELVYSTTRKVVRDRTLSHEIIHQLTNKKNGKWGKTGLHLCSMR